MRFAKDVFGLLLIGFVLSIPAWAFALHCYWSHR